ncbi:MAG: hypothetical protein HY319_07915 [Armatimonadetes bacterium]|nr:hypothetical protein [Armatimonadota bacterium]
MRLLFLLTLCGFLAAPAVARPIIGTGVQIKLARPERVELQPGGKPVTVRMLGEGFDAVKAIHVWRDGERSYDLEVEFQVPNQNTMDLKIQASSGATAGRDYRLILVTRKWSERMPLPVEVLDPALPAGPPPPEFDEPKPKPPGSWF